MIIAGCSYNWEGVSPPDQGGTGGAAEGGRVETGGSVEGGGGRGGVSVGGAAGSAAAGGAPSAGGNGGITTGGTAVGGGVAGAPTGGVAGSVAGGGTGGSVADGGAGATAATGGAGGSGGVGGSEGGAAGNAGGGVAGGGALPVGGTGGIATGGTGGSADGGAASVAGATGTCPGNLLTNPGFEDNLTDWHKLDETAGARLSSWEAQSDVRASGELALLIDTTAVAPPTSTYRLVIGSSPLSANPGDSFELTAVAQGSDGGDGYPSMGIQFYNSSGARIADPVLSEVQSATMTPVGPVSATAPESTVTAGVVFVSPNDALLYVDDLCLVR